MIGLLPLVFSCTALLHAEARPADKQSCVDSFKTSGKKEAQVTYEWQHYNNKVEKRVTHRRIHEDSVACTLSLQQREKARGAGRRQPQRRSVPLVDSLFERVEWRNDFYNITPAGKGLRCLSGYNSLMRTDRCGGFERTYPPVGGTLTFINHYLGSLQECDLHARVSEMVNVWACKPGGGSTRRQALATEAVEAFTNAKSLPELKPTSADDSWMDRACKVFGPFPFMWTCSKRLNVVFQSCGTVNAFVFYYDIWGNLPETANQFSPPNQDNTVYICWELVDYYAHNPVFIGAIIAHEVGHMLQAGFGLSFQALMEGGATWLEGALLANPPRPIYWFGWAYNWNTILNAHFYASYAGKYYQMSGIFLTYLAQDCVLGQEMTESLHRYLSYSDPGFGRGIYDYFLSFKGKHPPPKFTPISLDVSSANYPLAQAWVDFHVALAAKCILDVSQRPKDARYKLPARFTEHPFWDCSSYPVFWSSSSLKYVAGASANLGYGGAQVWRLATPQNAEVTLDAAADALVRTVVLAAGDGHWKEASVVELTPGRTARFGGGAREVYVIQVNCDPQGEMLTQADLTPYWAVQTDTVCPQGCWEFWGLESSSYPPNTVQGLRTPELLLPVGSGAELTFNLRFDLEPSDSAGEVIPGCAAKGWDGLQVRVHRQGGSIAVLEPDTGYGTGPSGERALWAWLSENVYADTDPCRNFRGWTGRNPAWPSFESYRVDLSAFKGKSVKIEFLFASDMFAGGQGVWLENIAVSAGGAPIFQDVVASSQMVVYPYLPPVPPAGTIKPYTGVPIVAQYPAGFAPDTRFVKRYNTRKAPWSASWCGLHGCSDCKANLLRQYVGYPFRSFTDSSVRLHARQEVCTQITAPFSGTLRYVTVQTLRPKVDIQGVELAVRSAKLPHRLLGLFHSCSPGALDETSHRYITQRLPLAREGAAFLLCVGLKPGGREPGSDAPYLDLPLTPITDGTGQKGQGRTFLWQPAKKGARRINPFNGYTAAVWGEFVQAEEHLPWSREAKWQPLDDAAPAPLALSGGLSGAAALAALAAAAAAAAAAAVLVVSRRWRRRWGTPLAAGCAEDVE